jgi:hypothetical protein
LFRENKHFGNVIFANAGSEIKTRFNAMHSPDLKISPEKEKALCSFAPNADEHRTSTHFVSLAAGIPGIRACLMATILALCGVGLTAQGLVIDRNTVADFDRIPTEYKERAAQLRMLFMDRSVGANISSSLDCLASPWSTAPSYCKRYQHRDSAYAVDPSEVYWNGVWDRSRWTYVFWPNNCSEDVQCFADFAEPMMDTLDVAGCQFSYLAVTPGSRIADTVNGFFGSKPGRNHAKVYADFAAHHAGKTIVWWTTSLARGIGTPESESFNAQMREYARNNGVVLFDVADILSHDPAGKPCYDNRDGVDYLDEQHPDDGLSVPAICPQYTTETEGGHLGSISAGGIRVAKAFWVLMARIAGWDGLTGAADQRGDHPVRAFPNPAGDHLLIDWTHSKPQGPLRWELRDLTTGRTWLSGTGREVPHSQTSLSLGGIPAGIYQFSVFTGGRRSSVQLVAIRPQ